LRFVWSRIVRALMKQSKSSFFALNMDILAVFNCLSRQLLKEW
jgi:hypothetical protein